MIAQKSKMVLSKSDRYVNAKLESSRLLILLLLIAAGGFLFFQLATVELFLANKGSSVLHWLYLSLDPVKSEIDWPTGTRNLGKSITVNIYKIFDEFTNVNIVSVINVYIVVEVLVMLLAFYYFYRTSSGNSEKCIAVVFALTLCLTAFQSMNLARFGYPFSWGLYYSLASAFRILAIAFVLRRRPWAACSAFSISIMIHPIMGGVASLAGAAVILSGGLRSIRLYIIPGIVMAVPVLLWFALSFSGDNISEGRIPTESWLFFTKLFNSHWYPFTIGVFDTLSTRHWLPFLSILVIYTTLAFSVRGKGVISKEINILVVTLGVITCIGLGISYWEVSPFLIKLSLHRASDLLVVVAFVPVVMKLCQDITNVRLTVRISAVVLLLSPFVLYRDPGLPLVFALLYSARFAIEVFRQKGVLSKFIVAIVWLIAAVFMFEQAWPFAGNFDFTSALMRPIRVYYIKADGLQLLLTVLMLIVVLWVVFAREYKGVVFLGLLIVISLSIPKLNYERTKVNFSEASLAYYDAQMWAKTNTLGTALFMIDPAGGGSWRDISERASYGTFREWLHNAWLYDSDYRLYQEGVRRAKLLNIDVETLQLQVLRDSSDKRRISKAIRNKVRDIYYNSDGGFYTNMANAEGVDYFVFQRKYISKPMPSVLELVYVNDYVAIFECCHN